MVNKARSFALFLGGVGAAVITGLVTYQAARMQSRAAIDAAIESAAQPLLGYPASDGIWLIGDDHKLVFCKLKEGASFGEYSGEESVVICSKPQYVGTY